MANLEVVMTAIKNEEHSIMRLERLPKALVDYSKVHHVGGGPYKGILINKQASDLEEVMGEEARLEFLAYLSEQDGHSDQIQDYWILKFWFQGNADGLTRKKTFTDYFQELMSPRNFPKNYIGFVKRALVLLKKYEQIRRVDFVVQKSEEADVDEELPPIKSFVTVYTPDSYTYQLVPEVQVSSKEFLAFKLKAGGDAHIALSAVYGDLERKTHEIVIGAEGNTKSMIREGSMGLVRTEALTYNVLHSNEFRFFWVSWAGGNIEVGRGAKYGQGRFLHWRVPEYKRFNVNCLAVSTGRASRGQWEFAELLDANFDLGKESKAARKEKAKMSLLWLAKRQRLIQVLEDAYPNSVNVSQLLQNCKIKQTDTIAAVVMLKDLEKRGLIKEMDKGVWMRVPRLTQDQSEQIEMVERMPILDRRDQPQVAIITAFYCEKLAVDAMIEDKKTYVRYKSEGESQVYTLGRIGRVNVVSTKLSRIGSGQNAMISAENTTTRLLGTFSHVEHVLLVGVGGAVPHFSDFSQHVRLGDVVVSSPANDTQALYIQCTKVETMAEVSGYSYITRSFQCIDQTLQRAVQKLRQRCEAGNGENTFIAYIEEAKERLHSEESSFARPSIKSDKLFLTKPDGQKIQMEHPKPFGKEARLFREGQPYIRYGTVGAGRLVSRNDHMRREFAEMNGIKAYDAEYDAVLQSLEGNRNDSFLLIRGMADYVDGSNKDWQPYAALVAAAYMKALICNLR
ncbi:uncharacterized protein LOC135472764 isoform X4 [Liolophura sinensis]|uniref:uncharacterized protein LOC135472764 isoform X4 n=1 Tax=Liolophura sinensis TaxID=3198878 RepID=UPI00315977D7